MKANELMIGDWVKYTQKRDQYFQVIENSKTIYIRIENIIEEGVNEEYRQGDSEWIEYDEIEPIPLTEEILKANGLIKVQHLYALNKHLYICVVKGVYYITDVFNNIFAQICYAHELQHALRLCGLNDLADNFKV